VGFGVFVFFSFFYSDAIQNDDDSEILSILLFAVVKLDKLIRPDPEIDPHGETGR
jgi:hypothetical protein